MAAVANYICLPHHLLDDHSAEDGLLRIPSNIQTLTGFRRWVHSREFPEKLRAHYVGGSVYLDLSEESIDTHLTVKAAVFLTVMTVMEQSDLGQFYCDGVQYTNKTAGVSNNPDGLAFFWQTADEGRVQFVKGRNGEDIELEGSPDWVLEIVSDNSVRKDTKELRRRYHKAGIAEYWLIDACSKDVSFRIFNWRESGYTESLADSDWLTSEVFERKFRLTRKKNRIGSWRYTLDAQ